MISLNLLGRPTMASVIFRHKRAHAKYLSYYGVSSKLRLCFFPALVFVRWQEARALTRLMKLRPDGPDEAYEKLVYLAASMIADPNGFGAQGFDDAIENLKPYSKNLWRHLSKRDPGQSGIPLGDITK